MPARVVFADSASLLARLGPRRVRGCSTPGHFMIRSRTRVVRRHPEGDW
jgi:hypothetical protein